MSPSSESYGDWLLTVGADRLRELFASAPGFMVILSGPEHRLVAVNRAYVEMMGEREFEGRRLKDVAPELAGQGLIELCNQVYRSGKAFVQRDRLVELRRAPGGSPVHVHVDFLLQPIVEKDGSISGIFCQGQEIKGGEAAEARLRKSREDLAKALSELQAIFDHSHDVICTTDAEGRYTRVSRRAEALWGYRPQEMIGRSFKEFVVDEDVPDSIEVMDELRTGKPTEAFTNRIRCKDGTVVPVMWSSAWSEDENSVVAVARDMRPHAEAEEKLRHAQKMEAVGRLTGGVAHDFNNLLTTVIGSAELLAGALGDNPELHELSTTILDAAERGAELVSRLLAVSRRQSLAPAPIDCAELIESLGRMLRRTIGEHVELKLLPGPSNLRCLADRTQLTTSLLNLALNARDAMPAGGRLGLGACVRQDADGTSWAVMYVSDTGEGMSRETIERAREPFFTTKPPGQGSGLGLSMVDGFVTQSGGRLEISSEPGRGTIVELYLPRTFEAAAVRQAPERVDAFAHPAHILVVEDDDMVRDQVRRQLMALGYRVTITANGPEALRALKAHEDVELLFTDMVMPGGIDGRELAELARRRKPDLPVLITTGYTEDHLVQTGGASDHVLVKPYRRAELARKVSLALGR